MKTLGVIPARYSSTRLPGKPLMDICGKPMIYRVYERIARSSSLDEVIVATDDKRIAEICEIYAIPSIMTASSHRTAANRLQEVSERISADFYVQINGDEPLLNVEAVNAIIPANVPTDIEYGRNIITAIKEPTQVVDPTNIKVTFDDNFRALYMSRTPIPFPYKSLDYEYYKHVGIIGYNKKMLDFYAESVPGKLEIIEGIDTLRFLDYGKTLEFVVCSDCESISVDTEKDIELVRKIIGEAHNE